LPRKGGTHAGQQEYRAATYDRQLFLRHLAEGQECRVQRRQEGNALDAGRAWCELRPDRCDKAGIFRITC
jgi:hypothetical protein